MLVPNDELAAAKTGGDRGRVGETGVRLDRERGRSTSAGGAKSPRGSQLTGGRRVLLKHRIP
eukprot:2220182-Prymnesium_polylepis.1